ncbi:hypothetical protein [Chitinophaga sp. S165]|uniref:hypothetical protein n=1 Tax=Chitinophaga sp. S165 TaxID=2135462 RepID=UPI000D70DD9E|nr:hypothetical protein [Chitinophaga sp. S165]PWV54490.1 hypothetical protein C7475_1021250 [Chitinophaga sp. S165]
MKKMLTLLLLCVTVFSCSKDDNTAPGNGLESYRPSDDVSVDAPVMYTYNGVVHDQKIIKDYIVRRGHAAYFTFDASTTSGAALSSFTLEFQDDKNVLRGNQKTEIISKNDTLLMLAAIDSTQDSPKPEKNIADSLMDLVELGRPVTDCPTYYSDPCKYRKNIRY